MRYKIAVLPGDGIGIEIVPEAVKALEAIASRFGHQFEFTEALVGGAAYDAVGHPLPEETLALCKSSDAVLLGAIGGPEYDELPVHLRPEVGALLPLRKRLALFANLRPCILFPGLLQASTIKEEVIKGVDIMVIRELTGGLYFGNKSREKTPQGGETATDVLSYSTLEIERIVRLAYEVAGKRRKQLCSVDKANVLESSRLWRETVSRLEKEYPQVKTTHMYVDNCSMQLIRDPRQFDVIVTENMFGDILTDEASMLTGSIILSSPLTTTVIRDTLGFSVSPTARLSILYPLLRNMVATRVNTPGLFSTVIARVCFFIVYSSPSILSNDSPGATMG